MFKTAAKKLASIPALVGNSRSQPLQELIAAEELVLHSYVHDSTHAALIPNPTPPRPISVSRDSARALIKHLKL
jgi:hypothetical protein